MEETKAQYCVKICAQDKKLYSKYRVQLFFFPFRVSNKNIKIKLTIKIKNQYLQKNQYQQKEKKYEHSHLI